MSDDKFVLFGMEFDRYAECIWCHQKTAKFDRVAYAQPCYKCRETKRYEEFKKEEDKKWDNAFGQNDALNANKPAAIYHGKGKEVVINSKGDILSEQSIKHRPLGRPDTKI